MKTVLVVGASIAGMSAALAAAESGAVVTCLDKKKDVGIAVSCAEGIAKNLLKKVPFKIPERFLSWEIDGISFNCDDIFISRSGKYWKGYTIDRSGLENWLKKKCIDAGVTFLFNHDFKKVNFSAGKITTVFLTDGVAKKFLSDRLIAADGAQSSVAKYLNLGENEIYGFVKSYEYENIILKKPRYEEIFYGNSSPYGYGYIFPKSRDSANVGIGTTIQKNDTTKLFDAFKEKNVKSTLSPLRVISEKSGVAIINRDIPFEYKNVFFSGDSASVNLKPFVEGILPGIISGFTAGESSISSIKGSYKEKFNSILLEENSLSKQFLNIFKDTSKMDLKKSHLLNMAVSSQLIEMNEYLKFRKMSYTSIREEVLLRSKS